MCVCVCVCVSVCVWQGGLIGLVSLFNDILTFVGFLMDATLVCDLYSQGDLQGPNSI